MAHGGEMISELLLPGVALYSVEPHIYSVYPDSKPIHDYDQAVDFYDRVIGNSIYNRIFWGYSISEFTDFIRAALVSAGSGRVLDAGCGSLVFTAEPYSTYRDRPVVMLDQSIEMLRAAKSRLAKLCTGIPPNIVFLQGDILDLPFQPQSFSTVVSMSVLHVLDDGRTMLGELTRVWEKEDGNLAVTSLVQGRAIGDRYLRFLRKKEGVADPRTAGEVAAFFSEISLPTDHYVRGNMMFIHSR
jgi:ubiquinone/menaquinone biosynthesis C-methylase UbiE